jgi:hypothetical protein
MATLSEDIAVDETDWLVSADIPDTIDYLTVESEVVQVTATFPAQYQRGEATTSAPRIRVIRGAGGTTMATHSSGTTLTPLIPPSSAVGGDGLILDNTVDPPTLITSLVAPGAVLTGDSADLSGLLQLRRIGPFNVAWDSDPTNISSAGVPIGPTFDAGTVILATWATRIQAWAPTITPNGYIDIYEALADSGDAGWATSFRTLKHYVDPAYSDTGGELAAGGVTETFIRGPLETGHRMYFAVYTDSGDPLTAGEADIYAVIAESA